MTLPIRAHRPRTIPPMPAGMLRSHAGHPAGWDVLLDVDGALGLTEDDPLGVVLWHFLRRVWTWSEAPAGTRAALAVTGSAGAALLAEARMYAPHLAMALDTFAALREAPAEVDAVGVADGCDQIARWAAAWGLMPTATHFAEAAARAEPENAVRAMDAAVMCQRLGGPTLAERAEEWLRRAFALARVAKEGWRLLAIRALLAYGNWARDVGRDELARACYDKASRRARRHGRWPYFAMAQHNLLVLLLGTGGRFEEGHACAEAALAHYPLSDARIPFLAHDYAAWLTRHGRYDAAFSLVETLPPLIEEPHLRLLVQSSLSWAAGGVGRQDAFERAAGEVIPLLPVHGEFAGQALVQLAEGALLLGETERARAHVAAAAAVGRRRADESVVRAASALLGRITNLLPCRQPNVPSSREAEELVAVFAQRLGTTSTALPQSVSRKPSPPRDRGPRPMPSAPRWPLWGGAESLGGLAALQEVEEHLGPGGASVPLVLWMLLRRIHGWAATQPGERQDLVSALEEDHREHLLFLRMRLPPLGDALALMAALREFRGVVPACRVAAAAEQIGLWAAERGLLPTAVLFMEAAAAAEPQSALRALDAAVMCQRLGGPGLAERAEEWLQCGFGLARTAKQGRRLLVIRALLAYGNWARDESRNKLARACYERASRRARRYGRWRYFAMAQHNLLVLLLGTGGEYEEGHACAEAAFAHYPHSDPRISYLAQDYAAWLSRHGRYAPALAILQAVSPLIDEAHVRLLVQSSLAWAAGGAGRREIFEQAAAAIMPLVPVHGEFAAQALVQLAEGALLLGEQTRAASFLVTARDVGERRNDASVAARVAQMLVQIGEGKPAPPRVEVPAEREGMLQRMLLARLAAAARPPRTSGG